MQNDAIVESPNTNIDVPEIKIPTLYLQYGPHLLKIKIGRPIMAVHKTKHSTPCYKSFI